MNLYELPSGDLSREIVETLFESDQLRIERIVSHGHASAKDAWYDQEQDEWVLLVSGAARLDFENESLELKPGDHVNIPAHRKHRVEWTTPLEPTVWLAIHYR